MARIRGNIISVKNEMNRKGFRALGDATRLRIVELLSDSCCKCAETGTEGFNGTSASAICCEVTGAQKITSTVSQHLHELADTGLIQIERQGKHMVCSLNREQIRELANYLYKLSEPATSCCCSPFPSDLK